MILVTVLLLLLPVAMVMIKEASIELALGITGLAVILMFISSLSDTTVIEIIVDDTRGNLQLAVQHRTKGYSQIEFKADTLSMHVQYIPNRKSLIEEIIITDGINKWELKEENEGIGKDNFETIVKELKEIYPKAWPPPKQWRRVV